MDKNEQIFHDIIKSLEGVEYGMYYKEQNRIFYLDIKSNKLNSMNYLSQFGDRNLIILKPDDILKHKAGTAWCTSLFIYDRLKQNGYSPTMVFYVINIDNRNVIHSTVIVKIKDDELYNLEYSLENKRGYFKIKSPKDIYKQYSSRMVVYYNHNMLVDDLLEMEEITVYDFINASGWKISKRR